MRGFIQCALVAMAVLSISCEGNSPVRVRGLATNTTSSSAPESMGMHGMRMGTPTPPMAKGATPPPKGKSDKSEKSEKGKKGKSMKDSKSGKGKMMDTSEKGKGMAMMAKGKGKGGGKGKGKGMGMGSSKSMMKQMMMMGKGKGKGGSPTPPSPSPPTPAPTLPEGQTHRPTISPTGELPFPELSVTFTLFYTIEQFRLPLPSEFAAVAALTEAHVTPFYESGFDDDELVTYFNSATILESTDFNFGEPVGITYISTLVFTQDSFIPREEEVEALIEQAFSGANLQEYFDDITGLPPSNLFSTTTEITLTTGEPASSTRGGIAGVVSSPSVQRIALGAGVGAAVAALAIGGLIYSHRRHEAQKDRQKTLGGSDGHVTVGDITYDSRTIAERVEESNGLEDVPMDD